MRIILVLLLCLGLVGCVHYTPRERAAISGIRHGDNTVLSTMTDEELNTLKAKVLKEQMWLNAFSAGARGFGEGAVQGLHSVPITQTPQQQYRSTYTPQSFYAPRSAYIATQISQSSSDGCVWLWDCSNYPCMRVSLCDSTLSIVPPDQPAIPPIPTPSIKPIKTPSIPPVGTSECDLKYICDDNSHCSWQEVCQ